MDFSKFCDNCYQPLDECICPTSQEELENTELYMDFSKFCDNCYQPLDECICPTSQEELENTDLIFQRLNKNNNNNMNKKYAVLSLSGGMDSSTLLLHLLNEGYEVTALSFYYGQKHSVELERAKELVKYINFKALESVGLDAIQQGKFRDSISPITHQVIELKGLSQLLNSTLVEGGTDVPEGHYEQENMKDTVVPNRNKIFSSIIQAVALSISKQHPDNDVVIAMGIHAGDHAIYPDCRQGFRDVDFQAFKEGNWDTEKIVMYTPYLHTDKFGILADGTKCCIQLGLDFNEVYKRTNTSYKPIYIGFIDGNDNIERGKWYSDYKSASSVERIEAFIKLGIPDPVEYADETGPVSWEVAKQHVENILSTKN